MENQTLFSKFKGAVFAATAGDCYGFLYEMGWAPVPLKTLLNLNEKLKKSSAKQDDQTFDFSDDTEMALALAKSLIENKGFMARKVAKRFTDAYFEPSPPRGYGLHVRAVFEKLFHQTEADDPFKPAKKQFNGDGSYGNGSAMRVYPVALFYHGNRDEIERVAALSAKLTHAHIDGVNGAILQAMAVEIALKSDPTVAWKDFLNQLIEVMDKLEKGDKSSEKVYQTKLKRISKFLSGKKLPTVEEITKKIGTGISAAEAVSAAIYSFLCCLADKQPKKLSELNKVQQTIFYAISIGGDTDTIATMAGAIAGALYGDILPSYWKENLEGKSVANELAEKLYENYTSRQPVSQQ